MTWELLGPGETHDIKQSIILRKAKILSCCSDQEGNNMHLPCLVDKVPRRMRRRQDVGSCPGARLIPAALDLDPALSELCSHNCTEVAEGT